MEELNFNEDIFGSTVSKMPIHRHVENRSEQKKVYRSLKLRDIEVRLEEKSLRNKLSEVYESQDSVSKMLLSRET